MRCFQSLLSTFLLDYLPRRRGFSENTVASYRDAFSLLLRWLWEAEGVRPERVEVEDITPIGSLKKLEYLEIFHNNITDVSCLKDLKYLMDLNLVKNKVKDLTPLAEIKSLQRLWIHLADRDNPGSPDAETLKMLQEALPNCHIDAESTSTAGGWRVDPHYTAMKKMYGQRAYEPFEDSDPENMPEPWRSERLKQEGDQ